MVGIQTEKLFTLDVFHAYRELQRQLKSVTRVEDVLAHAGIRCIAAKDSLSENWLLRRYFPIRYPISPRSTAPAGILYNYPFCTLLYNPRTTHASPGFASNREILNSKDARVVADITAGISTTSRKRPALEVHPADSPLIRTVVADRIQNEMRYFLFTVRYLL